MRAWGAIIGFGILVAAGGADWTQFRGPSGTGVAGEGKPPTRWTANENVKWKVALPGPGSSSPITLGERVFVTCYSGYGADQNDPGSPEKLTRHLVCYDKATGKKNWISDVPAVTPEDAYRGYIAEHGYASSTPVTDGESVFVFFGKSGVKSKTKTELVVAMPGEVWGLNPDTGKLIWLANIKPNGNVCPAVNPGDGMAYVTGGFQTKGSLAVKTGGSGDVTATNLAWAVGKSSYVPTPVLNAGRLMSVNEDGIAVCLKAETGEVVYEERLTIRGGGKGSRPFYASPVLADGKLYVVSRQAGVVVLKAGDQFQQLEQNAPLDGSDFNASPAIVGDELFLRSNKFLYCIANAKAGGK